MKVKVTHSVIVAVVLSSMALFAADPGVNRHVKALRDTVTAGVEGGLEEKTVKGCEASPTDFVITVESLEGWKRCDKETWGRHLVEVRPRKEGSKCDLAQFLAPIRTALKKRSVDLALKEGSLSGYAYTVDGGKTVTVKTQKEFMAKKKCKEFLIDGAGGSAKEKKVVPVYADLEVESIETDIMTKDKRIGAGEAVVVHVKGKFNSAVLKGQVVLVPELMDYGREKRRDVSITDVVNVEGTKVESKDREYRVTVEVKKEFDFDVELKTKEDFDLARGLSLHLGLQVGGKNYPPLQLPLEIRKEFPLYLVFIAAGVVAALIAVIIFIVIRGRGIKHEKYRFSLRVTGGAPAAEFELDRESVVAGRMAPDAGGIALASEKMSRRHAVFTRTSKGYSVSDSNSTNGTFVNGVKLSAGATRALQNGDEVRLGDVRLLYSAAKK